MTRTTTTTTARTTDTPPFAPALAHTVVGEGRCRGVTVAHGRGGHVIASRPGPVRVAGGWGRAPFRCGWWVGGDVRYPVLGAGGPGTCDWLPRRSLRSCGRGTGHPLRPPPVGDRPAVPITVTATTSSPLGRTLGNSQAQATPGLGGAPGNHQARITPGLGRVPGNHQDRATRGLGRTLGNHQVRATPGPGRVPTNRQGRSRRGLGRSLGNHRVRATPPLGRALTDRAQRLSAAQPSSGRRHPTDPHQVFLGRPAPGVPRPAPPGVALDRTRPG